MIGTRFSRWVVIAEAPRKVGRKGRRWLCRCDCGTERIQIAYKLKIGRSNGCRECAVRAPSPAFLASNRKHGLTETRLHRIWEHMIARCENPNTDSFKHYGGRGISVCSEWRDDFLAFHLWALANGYADHLTIDRRDNDGGYSPENCRWATAAQQARNRSNTRRFEFNGRMMILTDISKLCGVPYGVLRYRLVRLKWSMKKAISVAVNRRAPYKKSRPQMPEGCAP